MKGKVCKECKGKGFVFVFDLGGEFVQCRCNTCAKPRPSVKKKPKKIDKRFDAYLARRPSVKRKEKD